MRPARLRDLPSLAWRLGVEFARAPFGTAAPLLAALAWPAFVLVAAACGPALLCAASPKSRPGARIPRRASSLIVVSPPPSGGALVGAFRLVALLALFVVAPIWLSGRWGPSAVLAATSTACAVLVLATPYPGRLWRRGPRAATPAVKLQMAASNTGVLMTLVRRWIAEHLRPGDVVEVVARDRRGQRMYQRAGFTPVAPGCSRMTLTVPDHGP